MKVTNFSLPIETALAKATINTGIEQSADIAFAEIAAKTAQACKKLKIQAPKLLAHSTAPEGLKIGEYKFNNGLKTDAYISRTTPCRVSHGKGWDEEINQASVKFRTPDGHNVLGGVILAEEKPYNLISYGKENTISTGGISCEDVGIATKKIMDKIV